MVEPFDWEMIGVKMKQTMPEWQQTNNNRDGIPREIEQQQQQQKNNSLLGDLLSKAVVTVSNRRESFTRTDTDTQSQRFLEQKPILIISCGFNRWHVYSSENGNMAKSGREICIRSTFISFFVLSTLLFISIARYRQIHSKHYRRQTHQRKRHIEREKKKRIQI